MDHTDRFAFINDARSKNPNATYAEVNKAWKKACKEANFADDMMGPNIGRSYWLRVTKVHPETK